jgi:hypothetical protein
MIRVLVKLCATRDVDDLDPGTARERTRRLEHWRTRVHDPRISDALFLTVEARTRRLDQAAVDELKTALGGVPEWRAVLVLEPGSELPLSAAGLAAFRQAAGEKGEG